MRLRSVGLIIGVLFPLINSGCKSNGSTNPLSLQPPPPPPLLEVVVSPSGSPGNPGTASAPTSLEGARTIIQNASRTGPGTLRVVLRGGLYVLPDTFSMGEADSGTADNPVEYAAYPNETPRIVGGPTLDTASFHAVDSSDPNYFRMDAAAWSKILVIDLSGLSLDMGNLASRTPWPNVGDTIPHLVNQAMEVFTDGEPLTLARYPDAVDPESVNLAPHADLQVTGDITPDVTGIYTYKGVDQWSRSYYQKTAGGEVWTISGSTTNASWRLQSSDGSKFWSTYDLAGPTGRFDPRYGVSGLAFLAPADGSSPMPGWLLVQETDEKTTIKSRNERMRIWKSPLQDPMWYGFGKDVWDSWHSQIASIDGSTGSITFKQDYSSSHVPMVGRPFFIYGVLEELTVPGEYFVDRIHKRLYLRPLGDRMPGEILVSQLQGPLVKMRGAHHVTWQGVVFEAGRDTLVDVRDSDDVTFRNCLFRNAGGTGLLLKGYRNLVNGCEFKQVGMGAIQVWGGDRAQLTRSETVIQNCDIHHFGRVFPNYFPAIRVYSAEHFGFQDDCIGITVQHNEIHHGPFSAIIFKGTGQTIRYNHIHHVCQWNNDGGAIYTTRDWGSRDNLVQYNLIRENGGPLGIQIYAIYLDMCGSGTTVEGNIIYRGGRDYAILHNGGRDVKVRYNVMEGQWHGEWLTNMGLVYVNNTPGDSGNLLEKLQHFNYQSPPWSTAYPEVAAIPNAWSDLQNSHWLQPEGSVFYGNLQYHGSATKPICETNAICENDYTLSPRPADPPLKYLQQNEKNLEGQDPMFVDPENLDFRLQPGSPMYSIPGFPGIDAEKIGIQR